mgnify:CR=1 FL=1
MAPSPMTAATGSSSGAFVNSPASSSGDDAIGGTAGLSKSATKLIADQFRAEMAAKAAEEAALEALSSRRRGRGRGRRGTTAVAARTRLPSSGGAADNSEEQNENGSAGAADSDATTVVSLESVSKGPVALTQVSSGLAHTMAVSAKYVVGVRLPQSASKRQLTTGDRWAGGQQRNVVRVGLRRPWPTWNREHRRETASNAGEVSILSAGCHRCLWVSPFGTYVRNACDPRTHTDNLRIDFPGCRLKRGGDLLMGLQHRRAAWAWTFAPCDFTNTHSST